MKHLLPTQAALAKFRQLSRDLYETLFPRYCMVCNRCLMRNERDICISCLLQLPRTRFKGKKGNIIERLMWDDVVCTERANSLIYYSSESNFRKMFFAFKYHDQPEVAVACGRMMAQDLIDTDFFNGMDCIIPIPLSPQRLRKRGYNQSERLAQGISEITGIPVDTTSVVRTVDNPTQTRISADEREENVKDIFALSPTATLAGKHVLVVDDMITTGSTVRYCLRAILQAPETKVSVISLGTSRYNAGKTNPNWIRP